MSMTFDPVDRRIIEDDTGGDNELNVDDVYSLWKEWAKDGDNAKHPQAMRYVGADPISDTQNLGSTFFLLNGWKIRPAESDHKITLVGNIFNDPAGASVFVPTTGSFTVNTETRVSNLVDSAVSRLDLTQLLNAVYIDTVNGESGTGEGIGTPTRPVDNIDDAFTIANRDNLTTFKWSGDLVLDRNAPDWRFEGIGASPTSTIDIAGFNVGGSKFLFCEVSGTMVGVVEAEECNVRILQDVSGLFRDCGFADDFSVLNGGNATFFRCYSEKPRSSTVAVDINGAAETLFRSWTGGLVIDNTVAGSAVEVDMAPGFLQLNNTNTGGTVYVRGVGRLIDNSAGSTVVTDAQIDGIDIDTVLDVEQGNWKIDEDANQMIFYDRQGAELMRFDLLDKDGNPTVTNVFERQRV